MAEIVFKPKPLIFRVQFPTIRGSLVRERITDCIKLRLQKITVANGYLSNFGSNVHHGMLIIAEPPSPSLNFWDADEDSVRVDYEKQQNILRVVVASYEKIETEDMADDQNPDELTVPAVHALKDIEYAMMRSHRNGEKDLTLEGLVANLTLDSSQHVAGLNPEIWIQTVSNFTMTYNTLVGDPYQQQ